MKTNDPVFWEELTKGKTLVNLPNSNEPQPEDIDPETSLEDSDVLADDSDLAMPTLIRVMTGGELPDNVGIRDGGGLVSIAEAENVDLIQENVNLQLESAEANLEANLENKPKEEGRGKRSKFANKNYSAFWRHNDGDDWRDDSLLPIGHKTSLSS
jgi:hypothetical protein